MWNQLERCGQKKLSPWSIAEIKNSVRYANPHIGPSPDGFNAHFYKVCWSIIGVDVYSLGSIEGECKFTLQL